MGEPDEFRGVRRRWLHTIDTIMQQEGVPVGIAVAEAIRLARVGESPLRMRLWWGCDRLPERPHHPIVLAVGEFFSGTGDFPDCEIRFEHDLPAGEWWVAYDLIGQRGRSLPDADSVAHRLDVRPGHRLKLDHSAAAVGLALLARQFVRTSINVDAFAFATPTP